MPVETVDATGLSYRSKLAMGLMMACAPCCSGSGGGSGGGTGEAFCGGCSTEKFEDGASTLTATIDIDCMGISGLIVSMPMTGGAWVGSYTAGDVDFAGTDDCRNGTSTASFVNEIDLDIVVSCCGGTCNGCKWLVAFRFTGRVGATLYSAEYGFPGSSHRHLTKVSDGCDPLIFEEVVTTVICDDEPVLYRHCDGTEDGTPTVLPEEICCGFGGEARTTLDSTVGCVITLNISE